MKIAIVGSGALGLYYGALLQQGGSDVHFLLRRDYQAIKNNGLKIYSINGDFKLPNVQGYNNSEDIGKVDLILVALKTFSNHSLKELITPLLSDKTEILTLQNGLGNEEMLADLFGEERIIGGIAFLCSNRGAPGEVHHLGAGRITIGEYKPSQSKRLEIISSIFNSCKIDCHTTNDLKKIRWEKLVWNIPFNGLSALLMQSVDSLLSLHHTRSLIRKIMLEVIKAANAQQLTENIKDVYAEKMLLFTDNMGVYKPSMQIDREEGRQIETEAIFRKPLEFAETTGIEMPLVEMLTTLLEQTELGRLK
ncbi:MAG: putative 2-dehydropantoate 2-reductase [Desulfuromonadaceae bacterium]|nr:putative 2-dehydropantoate 2-reductase [Desulfuromonadaceae bacterium]MDD2854208.1 putative 2-dehydropantoate 2-reductase [Desulfuromonadaceae bacterium]